MEVPSSDSEPTDLQVSYYSTLFMCILYITIGTTSTFANAINIIVVVTRKDLIRKYIYFTALDCGEFINAISYILTGLGRGSGLLSGTLAMNITVRECFMHKYWPHTLILGTELPAVCVILISVERICAVLKPGSYNLIFQGDYKYVLLSIVPLYGVISLFCAFLSVLGEEGDRVVTTQHCAIITSTGIVFATYHFTFIVLAYVVSFVSICSVYCISKKFATGRFGTKDNRLSMMMAITGSSILLVSSSSIVMLAIRWNLFAFGDVIVALTYAMPGFLSVFNIIISFTFRHELRHRFLYLIGLRRVDAKSGTLARLPFNSISGRVLGLRGNDSDDFQALSTGDQSPGGPNPGNPNHGHVTQPLPKAAKRSSNDGLHPLEAQALAVPMITVTECRPPGRAISGRNQRIAYDARQHHLTSIA